MAVVERSNTTFGGRKGEFWGLVQQSGPWRESNQDRRNALSYRGSAYGNGTTSLGRGGTKHAGHGSYESLIMPYAVNGRKPPPYPSKYVTQNITSKPLDIKMGKRIPGTKVDYEKNTVGVGIVARKPDFHQAVPGSVVGREAPPLSSSTASESEYSASSSIEIEYQKLVAQGPDQDTLYGKSEAEHLFKDSKTPTVKIESDHSFHSAFSGYSPYNPGSDIENILHLEPMTKNASTSSPDKTFSELESMLYSSSNNTSPAMSHGSHISFPSIPGFSPGSNYLETIRQDFDFYSRTKPMTISPTESGNGNPTIEQSLAQRTGLRVRTQFLPPTAQGNRGHIPTGISVGKAEPKTKAGKENNLPHMELKSKGRKRGGLKGGVTKKTKK